MSYTEFKYSGLSIQKVAGGVDNDTTLEDNWAQGKPGPSGVGSSTALWLHRPFVKVSFQVQNVGGVAGAEVL